MGANRKWTGWPEFAIGNHGFGCSFGTFLQSFRRGLLHLFQLLSSLCQSSLPNSFPFLLKNAFLAFYLASSLSFFTFFFWTDPAKLSYSLFTPFFCLLSQQNSQLNCEHKLLFLFFPLPKLPTLILLFSLLSFYPKRITNPFTPVLDGLL